MALTLKQAGTVKSNKLTTSFPTRGRALALKNAPTGDHFTKDNTFDAGKATRTRDGRRSRPGRNTATTDPAARARTIVPTTGGLLTP